MGCVSAVVGAVEAKPELVRADRVAATEGESEVSVGGAAGAAGAAAEAEVSATGAESGLASVDSCGFEASSLLSQ